MSLTGYFNFIVAEGTNEEANEASIKRSYPLIGNPSAGDGIDAGNENKVMSFVAKYSQVFWYVGVQAYSSGSSIIGANLEGTHAAEINVRTSPMDEYGNGLYTCWDSSNAVMNWKNTCPSYGQAGANTMHTAFVEHFTVEEDLIIVSLKEPYAREIQFYDAAAPG